jgi:hypothetical protein
MGNGKSQNLKADNDKRSLQNGSHGKRSCFNPMDYIQDHGAILADGG